MRTNGEGAAGTDLRDRLYREYVGAPLPPDTPVDRARLLAPSAPALRRLVARHFPPEKSGRILDLGCGYGALLAAAQAAGYETIRGVDLSPRQVALAAELGIPGVEEGELMAALAATPDASLDALVLYDVLEHFAKADALALLDACHRVLRPGGRAIIHVPNAEGLFGSRVRYADFTHELAFTPASITEACRLAGFARVEVHEDTPAVHGAKSAVRAALWRLVRGLAAAVLTIESGSARGAVFSQNLLAVAFKPTS